MIDDAFIARIHAKCVDDCGCLIWTGAKAGLKGTPKIGKRSLRRVMFEKAFGEVPPERKVSMICGQGDCLALEHMKPCTVSAVVRNTYATTNARLRLAVAATRESRKRAKLDMDSARAIRNSDESLSVLSKRYGVHLSQCSLIKRGVAWKEASPFSGLMQERRKA